jgi:hypothetical protein
MIHQFDYRWASYGGADGTTCLESNIEQKCDPAYEPHPRYWVPEEEVGERLNDKGWKRDWTLGWRRNARSTDERTMITCAFLRNIGVGDSIFCLTTDRNDAEQAALYANLNSLALDFAARQKVGGVNMSFYLVNQFPILPPDSYALGRLEFVVPRVLELAYTSYVLKPLAQDLGFKGPPFAWNENRRLMLQAELDAFYARAYSLDRNELLYILDPAEVKGADYPSETFRVLKNNEIHKYGEYRTARLVLAAWDRMVEDGTFARLDL